MKRILLEWGLIFSSAAVVSLSALWIVSTFVTSDSYVLEFCTLDSEQGREYVYLIVRDGDSALCNGISEDRFSFSASSDFSTRGDPSGQFALWGFDFQYCYIATWDHYDWALQLSLLIPIALLSLLALWLYRRFMRMRSQASAPS